MGGLSVEEQVLLASGRRCCLCFGLHKDMRMKYGQIAHLDRNHRNNDYHNLAFLCLEHHDEYDTRRSQSKSWTSAEVIEYRERLYEAIGDLPKLPPAEPIHSHGHRAPLIGSASGRFRRILLIDGHDQETESQLQAVPAHDLLYGADIGFDVTNPNSVDMRITGVYLDVIRHAPVSISALWEMDAAIGGAMHVREYRCHVQPQAASYLCSAEDTSYDYIKLSPGEMELFCVDIEASTEGLYELRAALEYSIGGETGRTDCGTTLSRFVFYDPILREPARPWEERPSKD